MGNIKWTLTVKRTLRSIKGEEIDTLEHYHFDNMEDASDAQFTIDKVGAWDELNDNGSGVSCFTVSLEPTTQE